MPRPKGSGQGFLVSKRHHIEWVRWVRERVTDAHLADLMASPFGHLFQFEDDDYQFQGQVYIVMCKHLRSSSLQEKSLVYEIGDFSLEFGPADFALMTGLKIGGNIELPDSSTFVSEVFRNVDPRDISLSKIRERFLKESEDNRSSEVCLKLAYLYLVVGVIIMDGRLGNRVPIGYLHLLDNIENFKQFPWGRIAYEVLVAKTHAGRKSIVEPGKSNTCEAPGFVFALQAWLYEVYPELTGFCAKKVENPDVVSPCRMMRWSPNQRPGYDDLEPFFSAGCEYRPVDIVLSEAEVEMLEALGVSPEMRTAKACRIDWGKREKKRGKKRKAAEELPVPRSSPRSKGAFHTQDEAEGSQRANPMDEMKQLLMKGFTELRTYVEAMNGGLVKRLDELEDRVKGLQKEKDCGEQGRPVGQPSDNSSPKEASDDGQRNSGCGGHFEAEPDSQQSPHAADSVPKDGNGGVAAGLDDEDVNHPVSERVDTEDTGDRQLALVGTGLDRVLQSLGMPPQGLVVQPTAIVESETVMAKERPSSPNPAPGSGEQTSPYNSPQNSADVDAVVGATIGDAMPWRRAAQPAYDVNHRGWDAGEFKPVQAWLDEGRRSSRSSRSRGPVRAVCVPVPGDALEWADLKFFEKLISEREWFDGFHMDAMLNMVAYNYDREQRDHGRDWTVLDMFIVNNLVAKDFMTNAAEPYVHGCRPSVGGRPWSEISKLYGAGNVAKDHWVLFAVSFSRQQVTVYDTLGYKESTIRSYFSNLCRNIPRILKWMQFSGDVREEFELLINPNTPRQSTLHDCGMLVGKILECIVHDISLDVLDVGRCPVFRRILCLQIRQWSLENANKKTTRRRKKKVEATP